MNALDSVRLPCLLGSPLGCRVREHPRLGSPTVQVKGLVRAADGVSANGRLRCCYTGPIRPVMPGRFNRHEQGTEMPESHSLPIEPEGVVASLLERFNSGKVSAMMTLYEPEAVFIAEDGRTVTGHAEIAAQLEPDLKYGLPLEAKARHVFVAGEIAQIVLDWSIDGTGPDGEHVHLEGSASDVVRRGADGFWRYVIDNNLGTAVRRPG